jgi:hypothetical protein
MKAYKGGKTSGQKNETDPNILRVIQDFERQGKKGKVNESGKKYSDMLLQLVAPFHAPLPTLDDLEHLLDIAAVAWNIANMKKLLPPAGKMMAEEAKQSFADDKEAIQILEKLVKAKEKKFPQEDLFIKDFAIDQEEEEEGGYVTVTVVGLQDFLLNGLEEDQEDDEDEEEYDEENNFVPGYINRNGFSITPRQPFLDWLQKTEGHSLFPMEGNVETTVYLLEEKGSNEEITGWLKTNFEKVFRKELENWYTDEKKWPKNRTYQLFSEWFDVRFHSMVYDFEDFPVDKDME